MVETHKRIALVLGVALFAITTGFFALNQGQHQTAVINTAEAQSNAPVSVALIMEGLHDSIPLSSYTWNASSTGTGPAARVKSDVFHLTFTANNNSPDLMKAATTGKSVKNASIVVNNSSGKPLVKWTLGDCTVTTYFTSEKASGEPQEEIDVSCRKIGQDHTSDKGETSTYTLDLSKGR